MHPRVSELIETLNLAQHPEGGFYREIFRSCRTVDPGDDRDTRAALTTIYFLLPEDSISRWHRVDSDEVWHLYEGGPLELLELDEHARILDRHVLARVDGNHCPVHTIEAGHWQAARSLSEYTLVGCTVAPGFDFKDFRMLADDVRLAATVRETIPGAAPFI